MSFTGGIITLRHLLTELASTDAKTTTEPGFNLSELLTIAEGYEEPEGTREAYEELHIQRYGATKTFETYEKIFATVGSSSSYTTGKAEKREEGYIVRNLDATIARRTVMELIGLRTAGRDYNLDDDVHHYGVRVPTYFPLFWEMLLFPELREYGTWMKLARTTFMRDPSANMVKCWPKFLGIVAGRIHLYNDDVFLFLLNEFLLIVEEEDLIHAPEPEKAGTPGYAYPVKWLSSEHEFRRAVFLPNRSGVAKATTYTHSGVSSLHNDLNLQYNRLNGAQAGMKFVQALGRAECYNDWFAGCVEEKVIKVQAPKSSYTVVSVKAVKWENVEDHDELNLRHTPISWGERAYPQILVFNSDLSIKDKDDRLIAGKSHEIWSVSAEGVVGDCVGIFANGRYLNMEDAEVED